MSKELEDGTKTQQVLYLNKSLIKKLKAYAMETDISFLNLVKPEIDQFVESLLKKADQIDQMREEAIRNAKARKAAEENPLVVPGHEVEPVGHISIEQTA